MFLRNAVCFVCLSIISTSIWAQKSSQEKKQKSFIVQLSKDAAPEILDIATEKKCLSESKRIFKISGDISMLDVQRKKGVLQIQENRKLENRALEPNDPLYDEQNHFDQIGLDRLWNITTGGQTPCGDEIVVAIFDDDFDINHMEHNGLIWTNPGEIADNGLDDDDNGYIDDYYGLNLDTGNDQHAIDPEYHGSSVSGIIGANSNNGIGIAGMNWNIKLMFLSALDKDEALAIEAFEYIIDQRTKYDASNGTSGAYVVAVNNSWGISDFFEEDAPILCQMFSDLGDAGILSVGATVNSQSNTDIFGDIPSDCSSDHLIVVTNVDENDELSVAGFGLENVDLGAPGEMVTSLDREQSYFSGYSGTSYSAPHVSGAIGLLYSLNNSVYCDISRNNPSSAALLVKNDLLANVRTSPDLFNRTVTGGVLDLSEIADLISQVTDITGQNQVVIWPNPVQDHLQISMPDMNHTKRDLIIYDSQGRIIIDQKWNGIDGISVDHLVPGVYALHIRDQINFWTSSFIRLP